MNMLETNKLGVVIVGMILVLLMSWNISRLLTEEIIGVVLISNEDCMSFGRCYMHYKIDDGGVISKLVVGPAYDGWGGAFKVGDRIKKAKWSNDFCINESCVAADQKFEVLVLVLGLFLVLLPLLAWSRKITGHP